MDEQTKIVLRNGPAGLRPGLPGGPDVWEVVHRSFADVERAANWLDQPASAIEIALQYYERHREQIDDWIRGNELAAETARHGGRSTR